ncbi:hypothetical protein HYN48_11350 [Flavobacterium magnum]|uniref:Uncharacterized protein n=1 Tax=Flavobacterium magnum TaxID=2162713 RepID=A0A2S0RG87_9FLAO|nr:hypothetical protein [Flavobacterium magnum]AWA30635.1 hypothetical protein HYN48_11350 [Flavobacterium magnum]
MEKEFKNNEDHTNPEKDPKLQAHKGSDDLDSKINTDFKSKGHMKSQTDDEDPATDPNETPGKPGFTKGN